MTKLVLFYIAEPPPPPEPHVEVHGTVRLTNVTFNLSNIAQTDSSNHQFYKYTVTLERGDRIVKVIMDIDHPTNESQRSMLVSFNGMLNYSSTYTVHVEVCLHWSQRRASWESDQTPIDYKSDCKNGTGLMSIMTGTGCRHKLYRNHDVAILWSSAELIFF